MYHLIAGLSYPTSFTVVDDTTYRASKWSDCIPSQLDRTAHWDKHTNRGRPIHETLSGPYALLASSPQLDFHLRYTPADFPELFI